MANNSQSPGQANIDDIQAFPVLTSEVSQIGLPRTSTTNGTSIGQLAEQALRDILAIRPTTADPKSFVAALNNAFTVTQVDGRAIWTWRPRSFTVQADMGEVTGAQASIHARAKSALDQSVLLLDNLDALRSDADDEDIYATRAIVRSGLLELVDELGRVGGPRVPRVDALFDALLGLDPQQQAGPAPQPNGNNQAIVQIETDPEKVQGLLGQIRDRFGLTRVQVNTIDEEQNLTNYLILVDHVIALRQNWEARKKYFTGQEGDVFLGTQLVQLGWALGVLVESVHEAAAVMDSVFPMKPMIASLAPVSPLPRRPLSMTRTWRPISRSHRVPCRARARSSSSPPAMQSSGSQTASSSYHSRRSVDNRLFAKGGVLGGCPLRG